MTLAWIALGTLVTVILGWLGLFAWVALWSLRADAEGRKHALQLLRLLGQPSQLVKAILSLWRSQ